MANRNKQNTAGTPQPKKQPGGAPVSIVKVDVLPIYRREQTVTSWRNALQSMESKIPRRDLAYSLMQDVAIDPHVIAVTSKIKDAVTSANWGFVDKEGKAVDEINKLIDSIAFETILEEVVESDLWGYSMVEVQFKTEADGKKKMHSYVVPKNHMRPDLGIISEDGISDTGIDVRSGIYAKTIIEMGDPKNIGLHMKAAPYVILKRGGVGDYAMYVQVFGEPIIDAVWDGMDETQRTALLTQLKNRGPGGSIVRPKGTDLELHTPSTNSNGDLQINFLTFCNKETSKTYLGSTETTEASQSSGYAQSETHAGQDVRKQDRYITRARRILNSRFVRLLEAEGYSVGEGEFIIEGEENELSKKESLDIIFKVIGTKDKGGLDLPYEPDQIYELAGLSKPDDFENQMAEKAKATEAKEIDPEPDNSVPPKAKGKKPKNKVTEAKENVELSERSIIQRFFDLFSSEPRQDRGTTDSTQDDLLRTPHQSE